MHKLDYEETGYESGYTPAVDRFYLKRCNKWCFPRRPGAPCVRMAPADLAANRESCPDEAIRDCAFYGICAEHVQAVF